MRGFDLAAHPAHPQQAGLLVDPQNLANLGRAVPENAEIGFDALQQQSLDQRFGHRGIDATPQGVCCQRPIHTAGRRNLARVFKPLLCHYRYRRVHR